MDLIQTGIGITKTLKNVARMREILSVFARHGFNEIIVKSGLHRLTPGFVLPSETIKNVQDHSDNWHQSIAFELRRCFEELGPSFVKLGQLLGTREDIFHPDFIGQMKMLQDQVKPIEFKIAISIIEESLGGEWKNFFTSIDEEPIGSASIGCVYKAQTLDGKDVVIKVRRPNIEQQVRVDFDILKFFALRIEKISEEIKGLKLPSIIEEFRASLEKELNFKIEALNAQRLTKNYKKWAKNDYFVFPEIYQDLSSADILVMDYLKGKPFNQLASLEELGDESDQKIQESMMLFIRTLLNDGFFHADLHGGNFLLLEDGNIGLIDFGLMGSLSRQSRQHLVAMLYSLINHDYTHLVYEFLEVADYDHFPNEDLLIRDAQNSLSAFIGLGVEDIDAKQLIEKILFVLKSHRLVLPGDWILVFRAFIALDGVGKSLKVNINLFQLLESDIKHIVKDMLSKDLIQQEALWLGKDVLENLRIVPRHIKWFLKESAKKQYAWDVSIKSLDTGISKIQHSLIFIGSGLVSGLFFFISSRFLEHGNISDLAHIPIVSLIFGLLGTLFLIKSLLSLRSL